MSGGVADWTCAQGSDNFRFKEGSAGLASSVLATPYSLGYLSYGPADTLGMNMAALASVRIPHHFQRLACGIVMHEGVFRWRDRRRNWTTGGGGWGGGAAHVVCGDTEVALLIPTAIRRTGAADTRDTVSGFGIHSFATGITPRGEWALYIKEAGGGLLVGCGGATPLPHARQAQRSAFWVCREARAVGSPGLFRRGGQSLATAPSF